MKFNVRLVAGAAIISVVAAGAWALSQRKAPLDPVLKSGPLLLDKRAILEHQTFWDNRDWAWYEANIPFLDTPDEAINTTYLYRWELLTKHLVYASPQTGWVFTEFIDRPSWSGAYGAISCPAGHQLQEARWLKNLDIARDYARYWTQTPGAQPRRYSTWLADAIWQTYQVQGDKKWLLPLRKYLQENFAGWQREHFRADAGMFWQTGHDDGMELNINSRQTADAVRGAPGYRPTLNSYLFADARALAKMARLDGDKNTARAYDALSVALKDKVQQQLWDEKRQFFFHQFRDNEADGLSKGAPTPIAARSLTYQSGPLAGNEHGRELMGYVPWQFGLPDKNRGYEAAWKFLNDAKFFQADYGPSVVERNDPLFKVTENCCWWSGQSWPYATSQTLTALANVLNDYPQNIVTRDDYFTLLQTYTRTHRKDGRPYLAEAAHPDTGSWQGYDHPQHSEHYFHSGYNDQIITGLIGLRPRDDNSIELNPLAPLHWKYFALDDVLYRGHRVSVFWDADGTRYRRGRGLQIWIDGKRAAQRATVGSLKVALPQTGENLKRKKRLVNYAVNNDNAQYPRLSTSLSSAQVLAGLNNLVDGVHFYAQRPHNRWTFKDSPNAEDWLEVDFGTPRPISQALLYWLDDGENSAVRAPQKVDLQWWDGAAWRTVPAQKRDFSAPTGHRANRIEFKTLETRKIRVQIAHRTGAVSGLTEIELWGA